MVALVKMTDLPVLLHLLMLPPNRSRKPNYCAYLRFYGLQSTQSRSYQEDSHCTLLLPLVGRKPEWPFKNTN